MAVAAGATIALVAAGVFAVSLLAAPATACSPAPPPPGRRRRSGGGVSGGGVRAGR